MKSADLIAAFSAIKHGLDKAIAQEKVEALRVATEVGVKSFSTPWGAVTVAQSPEEWRVRLDGEAFLNWVSNHHPEEIETVVVAPVTRVKPIFEAVFRSRLTRIGDAVFDNESGEVVDFATPIYIEPGDPYITYPASVQQKAAKQAAEDWVRDTAQQLTDGLRERTAIGGDS